MTVLILVLALWGDTLAAKSNEQIAQDVSARLQKYGPHFARYVKTSTGKTAMEIAYRSPDSISMRAMNDDDEVAMTVDGDLLRVRLPDDTCALIEMRPLLDAIEDANLIEDSSQSLEVQLDYRISADGNANLNVAFRRDPFSTPFRWIVDMGGEEAVVQKAKQRRWAVTLGELNYSLSRKTGILEEMSIQGEEEVYALRLESVVPLDASNDTERARCMEDTAGVLSEQLSAQLLFQVYLEGLPEVIEIASGLDEAGLAKATEKQTNFWRTYVTNDLPLWLESRAANPGWREYVLAQIGDQEAFSEFAAQFPEEDRLQAIDQWRQAWYQELGKAIMDEYFSSIETVYFGHLEEQGIDLGQSPLFEPLFLKPLTTASLDFALIALRPFLTELVRVGTVDLILTTPEPQNP